MLSQVREWLGLGGSLPPSGPGARAAPGQPPPPPPQEGVAARPMLWPASRIAAVEALWGTGFVSPGGAAETLRYVKPLGLNAGTTLLVLGGGLGGPAQAVATAFGAWVTSLEADPELAAAAARLIGRSECAPRVRLERWDPAAPVFRPRCCNHALVLEALGRSNPERLLDGLARAVARGGQIVLVDLASDRPLDEADAEIAAWCRLEDRRPELESADSVTNALAQLGFDVPVVEDISERHMSLTMAGWRHAVREMAAGPKPSAVHAGAMVHEAELWLLRLRLMRRHGIRLMRWHAIGRAS